MLWLVQVIFILSRKVMLAQMFQKLRLIKDKYSTNTKKKLYPELQVVLLSIIRQSKNIGCCCSDVIFHIRRLPLWGVCTTPWAESQKVRKQETTGCSHPPRHMMACHMFSAALYFKLLTLFYLPIISMKGRCVLSAAEMQYKHCVLVLNQLDNQGQVITCSSSYYIFRSWLFIRKHTFKFEMF